MRVLSIQQSTLGPLHATKHPMPLNTPPILYFASEHPTNLVFTVILPAALFAAVIPAQERVDHSRKK